MELSDRFGLGPRILFWCNVTKVLLLFTMLKDSKNFVYLTVRHFSTTM